MKRSSVALVFLALAFVLAACSSRVSSDDPATPETPDGSSAPRLEPVPAAHLRDGSGNRITGAAGTRCWGRMCVDMVGPITPANPTRVRPNERLEVTNDAGAPTEAQYAWLPAPDPAPTTISGERAWSGLFPRENQPWATSVTTPQAPGRYVLIAFAQWQGRGDISYGWYLEVR